jgi:hypothetical protein
MAINPAKLTQSDLLQVINATPLGVVLSRPRLRRQMDAGGLRFGEPRVSGPLGPALPSPIRHSADSPGMESKPGH